MRGVSETLDVLIAGAGPAGVATAVALVQRDRPSRADAVLDKARFPRDKPCGGGLTGHAATRWTRWGWRCACRTCRRWRRASSTVARRTARLGRPVDVVRRREFDADLVAQARARGIEIVRGGGAGRFHRRRRRRRGATSPPPRAHARRRACWWAPTAPAAGSGAHAGRPPRPAPPLRLFRAELPAARAALGEHDGLRLLADGRAGCAATCGCSRSPAAGSTSASCTTRRRPPVRRRASSALLRRGAGAPRRAAARPARAAGPPGATTPRAPRRRPPPALRRRRRRHRRA